MRTVLVMGGFMRFSRVSKLIVLMPVLVLFGCASLESDVEPDWRSAATVGGLADTDASRDGQRVVVGNQRSVVVVDGDSGAVVGVAGDQGILNSMQMTVSVAGTPLAFNLHPESSNILLLDEANLLLILDYHGTDEQITAMDLRSGDQAWSVSGLNYSIQQYEETVRRAASGLGQALAGVLGGQASGESIGARRYRQRDFARGLAASVDGGKAILFKTFNGLVKLDAGSGRQLWRIESFNGPGILQLEELDNGDYLILSRGRNLAMLQAASAYHLARISPNGRVRWLSEHAGTHTNGLQVTARQAIVQGERVEVFNLANGAKVWESPKGWATGDTGSDSHYMPEPAPLITRTALYQAAHIHGEDGRLVTVGFPHQVRSFDVATGEARWQSEVTQAYFGALHEVGGQLIVWGIGEFFNEEETGGAAGLNRDTGELLWRTPALSRPGRMSRAPWVVEPVYDAAREHLFVAGPNELYGVRLADGELVRKIDLSATEVGSALALVRHDGAVVLIGEDGVAAFEIATGRKVFDVTTERIVGYERRGDRLVLRVTEGGLAQFQQGGPDTRGLITLDLNDGRLGELIVWKPARRGVLGALAGGDAFLTEDGRYAFVMDEEGRLLRYSL